MQRVLSNPPLEPTTRIVLKKGFSAVAAQRHRVRWLTEGTDAMIETWRFKCCSLLTCFVLTVPQVVDAAEETSREMWQTLLINWFPMLLLIGVWFYFMRNMKKQPGKWQSWGGEEITQHLEKIEQSLERIAKALEKK